MSDPVAHLNAAREGQSAVERKLGGACGVSVLDAIHVEEPPNPGRAAQRAWREWGRSTLIVLITAPCISLSGCSAAADPVAASECTIGVDCEDTAGDSTNDDQPATGDDYPPITAVEIELLSLINAERASQDPPRPALQRDQGMDRIISWHVTEMAKQKFLSHTDQRGLRSEGRARAYGDDPRIRCLEIIQWWGGAPSGRVHYEGYKASPLHRAGYLEQAPYSLGPTTWAGVAAVAGTGPTGSAFEGRSGSYTGVTLCGHPVTLTSDPFQTSGD